MFTQLTGMCQGLPKDVLTFLQSDMQTRRARVESCIAAHTISADELLNLIKYKFVIPDTSMAAQAIHAKNRPVFQTIVENMKRGWDIMELVFVPAKNHDNARTHLQNELTMINRWLREHGINVADTVAGNTCHARWMRLVDWRAAVSAHHTELHAPQRKRKRDSSATTVAALQKRQQTNLALLQAPVLDPCYAGMAKDWTDNIALRRKFGRANHSKFYTILEACTKRGGAATAHTAGVMFRAYWAQYPGSYIPCTTEIQDPHRPAWGCTRLMCMMAHELDVAWGGALANSLLWPVNVSNRLDCAGPLAAPGWPLAPIVQARRTRC